MNLLTIFKKEAKSPAILKFQKLEKNQLEKVIGGTDGSSDPDSTESTVITDPKKKGINAINH